MSAFIVHPEHINTLLWAGLQYTYPEGALRWEYDQPSFVGELRRDSANTVGQVLLDANFASVNHRYHKKHEPIEYSYAQPLHTSWSIGELLNALHCYEHQSDEHPEWSRSQAHAFCRSLEARLIGRLPGYRNGPWAITPTTVPAAHRTAV